MKKFDAVLFELETEMKRLEKKIEDYKYHAKLGELGSCDASKHRAAVKRSSMDVTRVLTQLRKAGLF